MMWGGIGTDVRLATRALARSPGLAVAAILVLGLGLGANATVFSALKSTVLAPLPYPDPETLVMADIVATHSGRGETRVMPWSYPKFQVLSETEGRRLDPVAGFGSRPGTLSSPGDAEQVDVEAVTPDYFRVLGLAMTLGRAFGADEGDAAAPPQVAVISHALWQSRFGGARDVLGAEIELNSRPLTVVGVAPAGFEGLSGGAAIWVPVLASEQLFNRFMVRGAQAHWMRVIGRLTQDTGIEEAAAQMASIASAVDATYPPSSDVWSYSASARLLTDVRVNERARQAVWLLTGAALLLLAVACANLAGLLFARSRGKGRDGAVRMALGGSRWRVIRGSLVESAILATLGAFLGVLLSLWGTKALSLLWPRQFLQSSGQEMAAVPADAIGVDGSVLVYSALVALVTAIAVGLWPALRASSVNVAGALKEGGGIAGGRPKRLDGRTVLVAAQVGMAVILIVGTGLLGGSILRMLNEDRGFDAENVLAFRYGVPAGSAWAEDPNAFHEELRERVLRLPGVLSITTGCPPLRGHCWGITTVEAVEGAEPIPEGEQPPIGITMAGDGYFRTLGVDLVQGRFLGPEDGRDEQATVVINERAARLLFPDEDPVGRRIRVGVSDPDKDPFVEVVGVVANVMYDAPDQEQFAELYYSAREFPDRSVWTLVRTGGDPTSLVPAIRTELGAMTREVAMADVTTVEEIGRRSLGDRRVLFSLLVVFAALSLALAATGAWGIVSTSVAERRRELGLRIALGAEGGGVIALVVRAALGAAAVGAIVGSGVALAGSRILASFLYETSQRDPGAYLVATTVLLGVVALAAWVPARRATRVDPVEALRAE